MKKNVLKYLLTIFKHEIIHSDLHILEFYYTILLHKNYY